MGVPGGLGRYEVPSSELTKSFSENSTDTASVRAASLARRPIYKRGAFVEAAFRTHSLCPRCFPTAYSRCQTTTDFFAESQKVFGSWQAGSGSSAVAAALRKSSRPVCSITAPRMVPAKPTPGFAVDEVARARRHSVESDFYQPHPAWPF
jgi:hypothetical protein